MTVYAITWTKSGKPSSGPLVLTYPEAAAQTFKKGDPVKVNAGGQVLLGVDTEGSLGIAERDASGVTNTDIRVTLHNYDDLYTASLSAAGATATLAQADVGTRCSYIKSTITGETAKTVVDKSDAQTDVLVIVGLKDPVGTVDGRVYFRWQTAQFIPEGV
jgi:hypothetical protein